VSEVLGTDYEDGDHILISRDAQPAACRTSWCGPRVCSVDENIKK